MTKEKQELVDKNLKLAYKIAWEYNIKLRGHIELEELQSLAFLGLVKAANTFDISKNFEFSTYAYIVMRNEIICFITKNSNNYKNISLSHEIHEDTYLEDTLASSDDLEDIAELNIKLTLLGKFISELNDMDNQIITLYLKGLNLKQISDKLGANVSYINTRYHKIINILRLNFYRKYGGDI